MEFALSAWDATVDRARTHSGQPFGLLVGFIALIALGLTVQQTTETSPHFLR